MARVMLADGEIVDCSLEASSDLPWRLTFSGVGILEGSYQGRDLFEAMSALRKDLESKGSLLLCAGARVDVYPSAMARAGGGQKAYITRMGSPAGREDLINILDYAKPELVGSVQQQWEFHKKWAASVRTANRQGGTR